MLVMELGRKEIYVNCCLEYGKRKAFVFAARDPGLAPLRKGGEGRIAWLVATLSKIGSKPALFPDL